MRSEPANVRYQDLSKVCEEFFGWPGDFVRSRDDGEADRASRAKPIARPGGAKRGRGMTARRPPAPVEAGRPSRTDSLFAANPVSVSAQLIFGAGVVKFPGWQCSLVSTAMAAPGLIVL
jgi:hypothetical protein